MGQTNNGAHDARRQIERDREKARREKHKAARIAKGEELRIKAAQRLIAEAQKARGQDA